MSRDVTVVGDGIIGLAIANEALDRGWAVTLVGEARPGVASHAAAGMLAPFSEDEVGADALLPLMNASLEMYSAWLARVAPKVGLLSSGSLFLARDRDRLVQLRHEERRRREHESSARWLDRDALFDAEPALSPRMLGGFVVERERAVDPRLLRAALRERFEARRGRAAVGGVTVRACGAWTDPWVRPVRGQALLLSGAPLLCHVIRTPDVYLVPRGEQLYVGATSEEKAFDARPTAGETLQLLREAFLLVPGIAELALDEVFVGLRPATRDHLPVIGHVAPGEIVASGHYRNGVLLAPITARLVADLIENGEVPALAPFDPARFGGMSS